MIETEGGGKTDRKTWTGSQPQRQIDRKTYRRTNKMYPHSDGNVRYPQTQAIMDGLPPVLRRRLASVINKSLFAKVVLAEYGHKSCGLSVHSMCLC